MNNTALRARRKQEVVDSKGGSCACGESRLPCLTLHHTGPRSRHHSDSEASLWRRALTPEVWKEIEACELLCHNCHAMVHAR